MRTWRLFRPFVLPYWPRLVLALAISVLGSALDLLRPWPLKIIVDNVINAKHHTHHFNEALLVAPFAGDRSHLLFAAVALILIVAVINSLCDFTQTLVMSTVGQRITFSIRAALYGHIHSLSPAFHDERRTGDLLARVTSDIQAIQAMVTTAMLSLVSNSITLVGMIAVMLFIDWQFALLALSVTPVLFLVIHHYTQRIKQATRLARRKEGEVTAVAQETFAAVRLVQAFAREEYEVERFQRQNEESLAANLQATILQAKMGPLVDALVALGTCFIVLVGSESVLQGRMTVGDLLVFLSYLGLMYSPVRQLSKLSSVISRATASADRIGEIMYTSSNVEEWPDAQAAVVARGDIEFRDVSFSYRPDHPVLQQINLHIAPGQTVALVGQTGAGKSSLASLLLRFYDPNEGQILLDGNDLRYFTLSSLRNTISIVPQESVLFRTTIAENIKYGNRDAGMHEIVAAAQAANAHEFIMRQAQGYDTVVSERGDTLSGGQRQRIAIARAMIRNAPILILDEPTSSLDAASEALTLQALERLRHNRTTLIIAHRLSTVRRADTIVVLDKGRIIEQGSHEQLLARNGEYRALLRTQYGHIEPFEALAGGR